MLPTKGYKGYTKHWENQYDCMDKAPWNKDKILKLTILKEFDDNLKELRFSNHSIKKENGKPTIKLKVPYNYLELVDCKIRAIKLLVIKSHWLANIYLNSSNSSNLGLKT